MSLFGHFGEEVSNLSQRLPLSKKYADSGLGVGLTGGLAAALNRDDWHVPGREGNTQTSWDDLAGLGSTKSMGIRNTSRGVGALFGLWGAGVGAGALGGEGAGGGAADLSPTQYAAADTGTMTDVPVGSGDQGLYGSGVDESGNPITSFDPNSWQPAGEKMAAQEAAGDFGSPDTAATPSGNGSLLSQLYGQYPKSTLGALGALTLLNTISSYRQSKARQQANQQAMANQQARINLNNANPNTGGANPSPTLTAYHGTPNYNPFIQQNPADRLAFGPASWQVQQAEGGRAGDGPLGMLAQGPGGGQDDTIPARLSDGEYVFSAQDVSDLGDGSTQAGARKLDQMRELIRSKAGRKNVEKIAPKQPDAQSYVNEVMS